MGKQCRKTTPVAHFRGSKLQCLCEAARPTEVHACVPSCHLMAPTLANQILARTFFRSVAHLFAYPAVEKFCRASSAGPSTALAIKFRKSDRVGRRGLFPMPNSASSPAYRLQTAALENQQNSPDLRVLDCYSTHSEPWSALALLNSRE